MNLRTPAEIVKTARLDQNLSQEELAYQAGVSVRTVSRLENGLGAHPQTLVKLAQVLGLDPAVFGAVTQAERKEDWTLQLALMREQLDRIETLLTAMAGGTPGAEEDAIGAIRSIAGTAAQAQADAHAQGDATERRTRGEGRGRRATDLSPCGGTP